MFLAYPLRIWAYPLYTDTLNYLGTGYGYAIYRIFWNTAPGSDFQIDHVTYLHRFSAETQETPVFALPLSSPAEVNRFIASKFVHLRVYFFETNQDDRRRARDPRTQWWSIFFCIVSYLFFFVLIRNSKYIFNSYIFVVETIFY